MVGGKSPIEINNNFPNFYLTLQRARVIETISKCMQNIDEVRFGVRF